MNDPTQEPDADEPILIASHAESAEVNGTDDNSASASRMEAQMVEDWLWIYEQVAAGALIPYHEQCIAVSGKTILGVGKNSFELEERVTRQFGLPREAIVIKYVEFGL